MRRAVVELRRGKLFEGYILQVCSKSIPGKHDTKYAKNSEFHVAIYKRRLTSKVKVTIAR